MIVYGTSGRAVSGPVKRDAACHRCGASPLNTGGVIRYFHVFWIPVLPYKRLEVLECPSCKAARVGAEVPEPARAEIRRTVFTPGRMLPTFAGAFLLLLLLVGVGFTGAQRSRDEAEWLAHPAANDHYVVKLPELFPEADGDHPYGVLEVVAVSDGKVTVRVPNYAYDVPRGAEKAVSSGAIRKADYFAGETFEYTAEELRGLQQKKTLVSVLR